MGAGGCAEAATTGAADAVRRGEDPWRFRDRIATNNATSAAATTSKPIISAIRPPDIPLSPNAKMISRL
jgi:hypothetical protein